MRIIIVGCGKVGYAIVSQLVKEGHTITVIDNNKDRLSTRLGGLDVMTYCGDGCSFSALSDAGIETADLFIAAMGSDETNLLSCVLAKKKSKCKTICRVRSPIYMNDVEFLKRELDIDMVINPELDTADECARIFKFPSANKIDVFLSERVELVHFKVDEKSGLCDKRVVDIRKSTKCNVLISMVERDEEVYIPGGDFIIRRGDVIGVVGAPREVYGFFQQFGVSIKKAANVIIVGGGTTGYYLTKNLIASGIRVKIIDSNRARCEFLAENIKEADIIHGDGTTKEILIEEGLETAAGLAAFTSIDEENIMLSIFAKSRTSVKTITKVSRDSFTEIFSQLNLDTVVFPNRIVSDRVLQYVRSLQFTMGSDIETLKKLGSDKAEAFSIIIKQKSKITGIPLMNMKLKKNVLICSISRKGKNIIPGGSDTIEIGDRVVIVHANSEVKTFEDILQ
ncbi:MAG: Trk system potassium transporter TrkA [Lachnospiraceae bacterium]|nr:Trk system potassium transporter TrkA [Lachnospiraceae bacterium]